MGVICIFPLAAFAGMTGATDETAIMTAMAIRERERPIEDNRRCFPEEFCLFIVTPDCPDVIQSGSILILLDYVPE